MRKALVVALLVAGCATVPPCENMRIPAGHTECREANGALRRKATEAEIAEAHSDGGTADR